jgi:hypothetical protein
MSGPADARPEPRHPDGRAAGRRRAGERLVALLLVGTALLNFPLLSVLRGRGQVAGVPALFVYLFVVWALLAGATALVLRGRPPGPGSSGDEPGSRRP